MPLKTTAAILTAALLLSGCHRTSKINPVRPSRSSDADVVAAVRQNPRLSPQKKQQIIAALSGPPDPRTGVARPPMLYPVSATKR